MVSYPCPICGNPNYSNQQYCSQCEFPVAHLDSGFPGLKQEQVVKWSKDKYKEIQKLSLQHNSIPGNLDENSQDKEYYDSIKLQAKIKQLEKEKAEIESRFHILDDMLTKLGNELPQHIFVDEATKQKLNEWGSNLAVKIDKWNNDQQSKCQYIYHSLRSELARSKCELKISTPRNSEQSHSLTTTPTRLQTHTVIQQAPLIEDLKPILLELLTPIETSFIENLKSLKTEVITEIKSHFDLKITENSPYNQIPPDEIITTLESELVQPEPIPPQAVIDIPPPPAESTYPWVLAYNHNPEEFSKFALEVSATEESINQRRLGNNQPVIIEKVRKGRGNYWLLTVKNENYLVPKGDLKINQYNLPTIEALFECMGESPENSQNLTLVNPAIVFAIESEKWQLQERGILQF